MTTCEAVTSQTTRCKRPFHLQVRRIPLAEGFREASDIMENGALLSAWNRFE